jgi:polyhydroxybutyrate depolymerase
LQAPSLPGPAALRDHAAVKGSRPRRPAVRSTPLAVGLVCAMAWSLASSGAVLGAGGGVDVASPAASAGGECVPRVPAGSQTLTLDVDGGPREVIVHVPASTGGSRLPAVIAFHGFSAHASELEVTSGLSALADAGPFVVAYPQGLDQPPEWHFQGYVGYDQRDLDLVRSLLDVLEQQACADPARIILAGHSMGGGMASDAACQLADRVAGVVLVSALWFELPCQPSRPVPVVATHALDDEVLPYGGGVIGGVASGVPDQLPVEAAIGTWAAHDGCGSPPEVTATDDGGAILTWPGCAAPVVLHRLASGGHAWPALASQLIAEMAAAS